jgi:hypothetical protein
VTLAKSDNKDVWIERFGSSRGECYLSFFNTTTQSQTAKVTVNVGRLGFTGDVRVTSVLGDTMVQTVSASASTFTVEVPAEDTVVVSLEYIKKVVRKGH